MIALLAFLLLAGDRERDFRSRWAEETDRVWVGPEYWSNPLQDWRLRGGRLECAIVRGAFQDYREPAVRGYGINAGLASDGRLFLGKLQDRDPRIPPGRNGWAQNPLWGRDPAERRPGSSIAGRAPREVMHPDRGHQRLYEGRKARSGGTR